SCRLMHTAAGSHGNGTPAVSYRLTIRQSTSIVVAPSPPGGWRRTVRCSLRPSLVQVISTSFGSMSLLKPENLKWPCSSVRVTRLALRFLISALTLASATPPPRSRSLANPKNDTPAFDWSSSSSSNEAPPAHAIPATARGSASASPNRRDVRCEFVMVSARLLARWGAKSFCRNSLSHKAAPEKEQHGGIAGVSRRYVTTGRYLWVVAEFGTHAK